MTSPNPESPVALITGSGKRRIGSWVAQALADRGYRLVIHYLRSENAASEQVKRFQERGIQAVAIPADLTDEGQVRRLVAGAMERFGRLDAVVNCAGIWHSQRLEEVKADDVRLHFETNTLGTFICSQQAGLAMVEQAEGGCIVTIGDWAVARPYLDYAAYFVSKGAIPALTRCLAVELGTRNPRVRVNCIMPGPVMLPPDLPETQRQEAIAGTLVQREGKPHHVVQAVLYLIDNDFVTGDCLHVDGGRSIFAGGG